MAAEAAAPAGYPPLPDWYPPPADPPPLLGAGRGAALVTPHFAGASGLLTGLPHCGPSPPGALADPDMWARVAAAQARDRTRHILRGPMGGALLRRSRDNALADRALEWLLQAAPQAALRCMSLAPADANRTAAAPHIAEAAMAMVPHDARLLRRRRSTQNLGKHVARTKKRF